MVKPRRKPTEAQEQAWIQQGRATRKFDGKVYHAVSDGWDTKSHALQSMPSKWIKEHYIRFTLDFRDQYNMWARKRPLKGGKRG